MIDPLDPRLDVASRLAAEVEQAIDAQTPEARLWIKEQLWNGAAWTYAWEPSREAPRQVTVSIGGRELVIVKFVREA